MDDKIVASITSFLIVGDRYRNTCPHDNFDAIMDEKSAFTFVTLKMTATRQSNCFGCSDDRRERTILAVCSLLTLKIIAVRIVWTSFFHAVTDAD